jgi:hypothetical protein
MVYKIFHCYFDIYKCKQKCSTAQKRGWKLPNFANSSWQMLLKAIGQQLGTAKKRGYVEAAP